jgi:alpha-amylase/alpha-mannosidase (GH57 family)
VPHTRLVIIHGHFYQPPREDPWLEEIPLQKGAAPWHDWNEKIDRECYRAVVSARVLDGDGKIARLANTLTRMSFDIGPTLFEWMERASPATYAAIIEADRIAVASTGHGNAMAQPYHHVILPLASRRDKVTEVRWGIADFRRRFGREPEGMWLPETAVDDETLDVLAQEGIKYTILAPGQVTNAPAGGAMGRYVTEQGREIAIGIYDGELSHGVAFGRLEGRTARRTRATARARDHDDRHRR